MRIEAIYYKITDDEKNKICEMLDKLVKYKKELNIKYQYFYVLTLESVDLITNLYAMASQVRGEDL